MKNQKKYIHIWISTVSMAAFLAGWGFFAHAPKTNLAQAATTASSQNTTSVSPLQTSLSQLNSSSRSSNQSSSISPTLRTGGS